MRQVRRENLELLVVLFVEVSFTSGCDSAESAQSGVNVGDLGLCCCTCVA